MREINDRKKLVKIKTLIDNTFKTTNPFGKERGIFCDSLTDKIILCPVENYRLKQSQFYGLIKTCKELGINKIYFSEIEGYDLIELDESELAGKYTNHYYKMDLLNGSINDKFEEYHKMKLILENAVYSENMDFGILISHEDYAVIGAKKEFMDKYKTFYPEWTLSRQCFEKMWDDNSKEFKMNYPWLKDLIRYIYEE
ncbi:hypothetical protein RBH29_16455 [Herbivorax sp. ANBcel31]|uniref:hypothetical protein n=1 Tax=Herbivorax sp. ANBcel31 TaxID=3069754 RepID=UPI0027B21FFA|nr:hypothetical protein [Herbivorax sp. ANBcel31]MDQ2088022.1 hypothetical protein [Herbivorax sp. ANBcel31]